MLPPWLIVAEAYTRYNYAACAYFAAEICGTSSNQFKFVRHIAATKFCRSVNDFTCHTRRFVAQPVAETQFSVS